MYWSKRAYLIALLAEELRVDITKNALQADIKKIRRELLKLSKSLDL